jgi:hypothetical protein
MGEKKSIGRIALSRLIGIIIFIILIGILTFIDSLILKNDIFHTIVFFLNNNFGLILVFSIVFLIGEIFSNLDFPFDVPSPIFNSIGAVLLTSFIFKILTIPGLINDSEVILVFNKLYSIALPIVFFCVLIFGYLGIFIGANKSKFWDFGHKEDSLERKISKGKEIKEPIKEKIIKKKKKR